MAILPTSLDYTDKDFDALKARLEKLIRSVFPTWTDFNVANFGVILLESFCFMGDVLTSYQDNQAGESRWSTARQRKNMIAMAKLIGFSPDGAKAATVDVTITALDQGTGGAPVGSVTIPAGTIVSTAEVAEPAEFQLLSDAVIAAGASPSTATVSAEHSANAEDVFVSRGTPDQEFTLGETPYLDDSAIVTAGDGAYTQVDDFLSSLGTDRHFTVVVNENDEALVRFGDGTNGKIPVGTITVSYKTGGGDLKVEAGTLVIIDGAFTDSLGNPLLVTVTNASESSGGLARQSVERIRVAAPESIRVNERAVSREDFEIVARDNASVARALMLSADESSAVAENSGILFIVPEGGGTPSQALLDEVAAEFEPTGSRPKLLGFRLLVQVPIYLDVDVVARVYLSKDTKQATAGAAIRASLIELFALVDENGSPNERVGFGFDFKDVDGNAAGEIDLSTVYNAVRDTTGVRKIGTAAGDFTLNGEHDDVALELQEFPRLGTVTLIDGDTGEYF